jgi:hypothetical protein
MVRCVQCDTELVAPVRSEYWRDKHACHIWHCPKCCACFSSLVSFSADIDPKPSLPSFMLCASASSCVSNFAADSPPRLILEIKGPPFSGPTGNRALCAVTSVTQQSYDAN